jgi:SAM-dependent methyltransferase
MSRAILNAFARWIHRIKHIYYPARWDLMKYEFVSTLLKDQGSVLDVGCSDGYGSAILSETGSKNVTGGDISLQAVEYAKQHYGREGLTLLCFDATNLPFPSDSFDAVVALEIIEHLPEIEQKRLLSECVRVLRNGGLIICSTPNKRTYSTVKVGGLVNLNPGHVKELSIPEFHNLLGEYCVDITLYGQWFMNSVEIIVHKGFLSACLMVEKFASCLGKDIRIGSFIYRIIISLIISNRRFKFSLLLENSTKQPLDVVAVARVVKSGEIE